MRNRCLRFLTVVGLGALTTLLTAAAPLGYHIVKQVPLPGTAAYYDYITADVPNNRLYVAHGDEVEVLNLSTQKLESTMRGFNRMHGIAVSDKDNHGFITDGGAGTIIEFDLHTLKKLKTIPAAPDADGIIYDPATDRVFAFCGDAHKAVVVDAATGAVDKIIDLGSGPEFATSDGNGHVFNILTDAKVLLDIDSRNLTILHRYPVPVCGNGTGMAMDAAHHRVFIGCRSGVLAVVNADNGQVVATPKIKGIVDAVRFDPQTQLVYTSEGAGEISVFHEDSPDKYTRVDTIPTALGMRTMEIDLRTKTLFTSGNKLQPKLPGQRFPKPVPGTFHLLVIAK